MTLALYGKSRKRQAVLGLLGALAVVAALVVAALALPGEGVRASSDIENCSDWGLVLIDEFNWDEEEYAWEPDGNKEVTIGAGATTAGATWTSTVHVRLVIAIVGGGTYVDLSWYNPAPGVTDGYFDSSDLQPPDNSEDPPGISNVKFCGTPPSGTVVVFKVVTNVEDDPHRFQFELPGTHGFQVDETTPHSEYADPGSQTVTEIDDPGYNELGWAVLVNKEAECPDDLPTQVGGVVAAFGTDRTAELTVTSGDMLKVCFFNEKAGETVVIKKVFTNLGEGQEVTDSDYPTFSFAGLDTDPACTPGTLTRVGDSARVDFECAVPEGWDDDVTEDPKTGWRQIDCPLSIAEGTEVPPYRVFCNEPEGADEPGVLVVAKVVTNVEWDEHLFHFTIEPHGAEFDISEWDSHGEYPAPGVHTITEDDAPGYNELGWAVLGDDEAGCPEEMPVEKSGWVAAFGPGRTTKVTVTAGGRLKVCFFNEKAGETVVIKKFFTNLGEGQAVTEDDYPTFSLDDLDTVATCTAGTLTTAGASARVDFECAVPEGWNGDVTENPKPGWRRVDCPLSIAGATGVPSYRVFCNEPTGGVNVKVTKTEIYSASSGPGKGWSVTLKGCGVNETGQTGVDGSYTWSGVPVCASYVVSEDPDSKAGFLPTGGVTSRAVNATTPGETYAVEFSNYQATKTPECINNCVPLPELPPPPSLSPPPPPAPAEKPKPVETVAGVKTPGPVEAPPTQPLQPAEAKATPIAPSAGNGLADGGTARNLVLIFAGALIMAGSLGAVAASGRRRK